MCQAWSVFILCSGYCRLNIQFDVTCVCAARSPKASRTFTGAFPIRRNKKTNIPDTVHWIGKEPRERTMAGCRWLCKNKALACKKIINSIHKNGIPIIASHALRSPPGLIKNAFRWVVMASDAIVHYKAFEIYLNAFTEVSSWYF